MVCDEAQVSGVGRQAWVGGNARLAVRWRSSCAGSTSPGVPALGSRLSAVHLVSGSRSRRNHLEARSWSDGTFGIGSRHSALTKTPDPSRPTWLERPERPMERAVSEDDFGNLVEHLRHDLRPRR